jgi:hypothetical protein
MPIYYTTRDRAKAESKGHRFEQDYNVFCSSDQEHKPLWQFSYAHGLVVGIEELADPEAPDQETQSFATLFDIATNCIERRQYASSNVCGVRPTNGEGRPSSTTLRPEQRRRSSQTCASPGRPPTFPRACVCGARPPLSVAIPRSLLTHAVAHAQRNHHGEGKG